MFKRETMVPFLLSGFLALTGCSPVNQPETSQPKIATQTNPIKEAETYPEIANYPIKAQGEFKTQTGSVRWKNFSDFTVNPRPLEQLFRYYQEWATMANILNFPWQKQMLTATLTRRPNRNIDLYLLPTGIPTPAWWDINPDAGTKVYYYPQGHEEAITIVKINQPVTSFDNNQISDVINKDAEYFLVTEACQSSIRLSDPGVNYRELQEVFCNSAGLASFMKKNNYSYDLYSKFINSVMLPVINIPYFLFNQEKYNSFSGDRIISIK